MIIITGYKEYITSYDVMAYVLMNPPGRELLKVLNK